jgi:hypothetical protein
MADQQRAGSGFWELPAPRRKAMAPGISFRRFERQHRLAVSGAG